MQSTQHFTWVSINWATQDFNRSLPFSPKDAAGEKLTLPSSHPAARFLSVLMGIAVIIPSELPKSQALWHASQQDPPRKGLAEQSIYHFQGDECF